MQTIDSQKVNKRFFEALAVLVDQRKKIRTVAEFTEKYDITYSNFLRLRKEPERDGFQLAWLTYLVRDFGVRPEWLLMGEGKMFKR